MKKIFIILFMFSFFSKVIAGNSGTAYDYEFNSIDGDLIKLSQYKGKVIVVVNVASRCGYTPQYEDLQRLWSEYKSNDLVTLKKIFLKKNVKIPKRLSDFEKLLNSDNFNRFKCIFLPIDAVLKALKL